MSTTKLNLDDLRVLFFNQDEPAESWSWRLACIKYDITSRIHAHRTDALYFGSLFLKENLVLDDPIVFDRALAEFAVSIVHFSKARDCPSVDIYPSMGDPILAAEDVRHFFTKRIGKNVTSLMVADSVTFGFIDILLDRRPGTVTPRLLLGPTKSCLITLQNDQFGDPQIKSIKRDIFGKEQSLRRGEIDILGDLGGPSELSQ